MHPPNKVAEMLKQCHIILDYSRELRVENKPILITNKKRIDPLTAAIGLPSRGWERGRQQQACNLYLSEGLFPLPFSRPWPPPSLSLREGDWGKAGGPPTPSRKMAWAPCPQIKYSPRFARAVKFNRRLNFLYLMGLAKKFRGNYLKRFDLS